jgi:Tol biopolymer transport system component
MYPHLSRTVLMTAAVLAPLTLAGALSAAANPPGARTAPDNRTGHAVTAPVTTASPLRGHGELAVVAHKKLSLLGGPAGALRHPALPGVPSSPAWSANHKWVAVQVSAGPSKPSSLWAVNAAGTRARRLTPATWNVTRFVWSPHTSRVALTAGLPHRTVLATVGRRGAPKILATVSSPSGLAWSPGGRRIAVAVNVMLRAGVWRGKLDVLKAAGGRPRTVLAGKSNAALWLAAWWPDGSGLLYWMDPSGSASISADGLPLYTVPLAAHRPHLLAGMLVHPSWLAFSPDKHTVAVVAGGSREIWQGGKHVAICRSSGSCTSVPQPAGVVDLQASWSPNGKTLVFMRASASGPFGPHGHAGFTPYWVRRWQSTSRLWTAAADGSGVRRLTGAGPGALDPVWGSDGSLLFVHADSLWLLPRGASA